MADLEKLAVQRDRGYLVRLSLGLAVALVVGVLLFGALTGERVSGCAASTLLGAEPAAPAPGQPIAPSDAR